jgi:hypothetical protein
MFSTSGVNTPFSASFQMVAEAVFLPLVAFLLLLLLL